LDHVEEDLGVEYDEKNEEEIDYQIMNENLDFAKTENKKKEKE
jgi:hypothetical protein